MEDALPQTDAATGQSLWDRARSRIPGGVNSPVRSFASVGGTPFFVERGDGPYLWDTDGNRYIDYVQSWGPLILGHGHPAVREVLQGQLGRGTSYGTPTAAEVELAERVARMVPGIEMTRLVNSGTEATMTALRLARALTDRDRILKFSGCYHGHADAFLVEAGSGVATLGLPNSPGVPEAVTADTAVLPFNDLERVEALFAETGDELAAVILEPVLGNGGLVPPEPGFLQGLRDLTRAHDALLIFDEVMTGFRVGPGGAQEYFGVTPDLTTLGKVIGGGLPVGAVGGPRELMEELAPTGPVYQAGTLSGNPMATAAGNAQLDYLERENPFPELTSRARTLSEGVVQALRGAGLPAVGGSVGSMWGVFVRDEPVRSFEEAKDSDTSAFARFHRAALERGVFFAPSPFEAGFVSTAHDGTVIRETLDAVREAARVAAGDA